MVSGLTQVTGITAVSTGSGTSVAITGTVNNFAALPSAASNPNTLYRVSNAQGSWILGTRKPAGIYESDGSNWTYIAYFTDVSSEIDNDSVVDGDTVMSALNTLNNSVATVSAQAASAVTIATNASALAASAVNAAAAASAAASNAISGKYIIRSFGGTFDGSSVVANASAEVTLPYNCRITNWALAANVSGQAQINLLVGGASLVGTGNFPTLAGNKTVNASASGWTTTIVSAFTPVTISLVSATTITHLDYTIATILV